MVCARHSLRVKVSRCRSSSTRRRRSRPGVSRQLLQRRLLCHHGFACRHVATHRAQDTCAWSRVFCTRPSGHFFPLRRRGRRQMSSWLVLEKLPLRRLRKAVLPPRVVDVDFHHERVFLRLRSSYLCWRWQVRVRDARAYVSPCGCRNHRRGVVVLRVRRFLFSIFAWVARLEHVLEPVHRS